MINKNQAKIKHIFKKCAKDRTFLPSDWVLKWDKRNEEPGKHEKFNSL